MTARSIRAWAALAAALALCGQAAAQESGYRIVASSYLGGRGDDDAVVGAALQADGTVILAANLAPDFQTLPAGGNHRSLGPVQARGQRTR